MYEKKFSVISSVLQPYSPKPIELFRARYTSSAIVYSHGLSPTIIYTGIDNIDDSKVAIKQIRKSKIDKPFLHEMAKNELAVHYSLSNNTNCNNIVKAKDYFEDDSSYYLVMEYSPDPNYFEDMFENVRIS